MSDDHIATVVSGHTFTIDSRYVLTESRILGKGSFGVVCTAYDSVRKIDIAVKRIRPYANDEWDARHCLREIRLMKLLGVHPNVISLFELSLFEPKTELYMYIEVMDCDLHKVIQSKQTLTEKHHKCFIKQILEGVKAMHSIGCFHRDLKPGNILVSKDCSLRITDFGLARFMDETTLSGNNDANPMTEYVVTRWYRPPELLLSPNRPYSEEIDLWSIGCILAELIKRKPLFPGKSHANQVQLMFEVMGYSHNKDLGFPVSAEAHAFLEKRCKYPKKALEKVLPEGTPEAIKLMKALLTVDPSKRPSAKQALGSQYLVDAETLYDYDEVHLERPSPEFFKFENMKYPVEVLKEQIHSEVNLSSATAYKHKKSRLKDSLHSSSSASLVSASSNDASPLQQKSSGGSSTGRSSKSSGKSSKSASGSTAPSGAGNAAPKASSTLGAGVATAVSGAEHYRRLSNADDLRRQADDAVARGGIKEEPYYDETDGPVSQLQTQMRNVGVGGAHVSGGAVPNYGHLSARGESVQPSAGVAALVAVRAGSAPVSSTGEAASVSVGAGQRTQYVAQQPQDPQSRTQQMAAVLARQRSSNNPYRSNTKLPTSAPLERRDSENKRPVPALVGSSSSSILYTNSAGERNAAQQQPVTSRSESGGSEQPQHDCDDDEDMLRIDDSDGLTVSNVAGLLEAGDGNLLTAVRNSNDVSGKSIGSRQRRGPKTPSPAKMDEILYKDMMNKKRFLLLQQQQHQQEQHVLPLQQPIKGTQSDAATDEVEAEYSSALMQHEAAHHQQQAQPIIQLQPKNRIVFPRTKPAAQSNVGASNGAMSVHGANYQNQQQQKQPLPGKSKSGTILSKLQNTYQTLTRNSSSRAVARSESADGVAMGYPSGENSISHRSAASLMSSGSNVIRNPQGQSSGTAGGLIGTSYKSQQH